MLSASSIAAARRVAARFLTSTATVLVPVATSDSMGGRKKTSESDGASYAARLVPYDVNEIPEPDRIAGTRLFRLYLEEGAVLTSKMMLRVDGERVRVRGMLHPRSDDVLHTCAEGALVEGD